MAENALQLKGIHADPKIARLHAHDPSITHYYEIEKIKKTSPKEAKALQNRQLRAVQARELFKPAGKAANLWSHFVLQVVAHEPKRLVVMREAAAAIKSQVNVAAARIVPQPVYADVPPTVTVTDKTGRQFELTKTTDSNASNMPDFMTEVRFTPDSEPLLVDDIQPDVAAELYRGLLERLTESRYPLDA